MNFLIKPIKFKFSKQLFYDKTSVLKGAGVMGVAGIAFCAMIDGFNQMRKSKKILMKHKVHSCSGCMFFC